MRFFAFSRPPCSVVGSPFFLCVCGSPKDPPSLLDGKEDEDEEQVEAEGDAEDDDGSAGDASGAADY